MKKLPLTLVGILALLAGVLLARTATFTSRQFPVEPARAIAIDRDAMAKRLSDAIQIKTISFPEPAAAAAEEFHQFHDFLAESFPRVHRQLTRETVNTYSLLYTWKGKDARLKPLMLMGHMDVVPVEQATEKHWTHPPYSGAIADGYVWGRGAMDDKAGVLGPLEAVENLLREGFEPQRTIYLAFGHDEEIGGADGAGKIADLLRSRGIELEFVLDEGMNVVESIIPGIAAPAALIGIAEKGYVSLELTVESAGGHSSTPPPRTTIGILSSAIHRLEASPFPSRLNLPTRKMLEFTGPEMAWHKRIVFANLWLFDPLVRGELARSPLTDATIRTTQAVTIFEAGVKENILPTKARAVVNFRVLPGETIDGVTDRVRKVIDNPEVKITPLPIRVDPSPVSDTEGQAFKTVQRSITQVMPKVLVAPALLVAATDSRHYVKLSRNIFRFLPITIRPGDAKRYHGVDERISLRDYERCVGFYAQLIRNTNK
jgi:carboxypeptidase PM20D1